MGLGGLLQGKRYCHGDRGSCGRAARAGSVADGREDVVVFVSVPADGLAADIAARVGEYAGAGATCIAVIAAMDGGDLESFVRFLAREVKPLVS